MLCHLYNNSTICCSHKILKNDKNADFFPKKYIFFFFFYILTSFSSM